MNLDRKRRQRAMGWYCALVVHVELKAERLSDCAVVVGSVPGGGERCPSSPLLAPSNGHYPTRPTIRVTLINVASKPAPARSPPPVSPDGGQERGPPLLRPVDARHDIQGVARVPRDVGPAPLPTRRHHLARPAPSILPTSEYNCRRAAMAALLAERAHTCAKVDGPVADVSRSSLRPRLRHASLPSSAGSRST